MAHTRNNRDSGRVRPKNNPYKRERFNNKNWVNQAVANNAKLKKEQEESQQQPVLESAYLNLEDNYLNSYYDEALEEDKE